MGTTEGGSGDSERAAMRPRRRTSLAASISCLDIESPVLRPIVFLGDALDRLRAFPEAARKEAGVQLHKV